MANVTQQDSQATAVCRPPALPQKPPSKRCQRLLHVRSHNDKDKGDVSLWRRRARPSLVALTISLLTFEAHDKLKTPATCFFTTTALTLTLLLSFYTPSTRQTLRPS